jgi:hypothetical protein
MIVLEMFFSGALLALFLELDFEPFLLLVKCHLKQKMKFHLEKELPVFSVRVFTRVLIRSII